jgi:hypothetical protein
MLSHAHDHDHDEYGQKRTGSQPRIPRGTKDVPLLDHDHPPLKFARLHHTPEPSHEDPGHTHYKAAWNGALANAVRELERELGARSAVEYWRLENETLIVQHCSQSKLSQQELADLQKATHFDKKELQQWYKGALVL